MFNEQSGPLTTKLKRFQSNYFSDHQNVPKSNDSYQLSTKGEMERIDNYRSKVFNEYRSAAIGLRKQLNDLEFNVSWKERHLFFPNSQHMDQQKKQSALMERSLALQKLQSSGINTEGMIAEIKNNFANGNTDANGEMYQFLLTHNVQGMTNENNFKLLVELKNGFKARGLDDLNAMKKDLATAKNEFATIEQKFKIN